jgi:hypothetical protein
MSVDLRKETVIGVTDNEERAVIVRLKLDNCRERGR